MALTTTADILTKFEVYAGDSTELSTEEELDLANKKYTEILEEHEWDFLKKTATGTLSTSVSYVTAPTDFRCFAQNYSDNNGYKKVIYVGTNYEPYEIITAQERYNYRNAKGYAWYDSRQGRITFTVQPPNASTYEFDYIYIPAELTVTPDVTPVFPVRYWDAIYHAMQLDNDIIQKSDKARRDREENMEQYRQILAKMSAWNNTLSNMDTYGLQ